MSQPKRKARKNSSLKLRPDNRAAAEWLNKYGHTGTVILKGRSVGISTMIAAQVMDYYKYGNMFVTTSRERKDGK